MAGKLWPGSLLKPVLPDLLGSSDLLLTADRTWRYEREVFNDLNALCFHNKKDCGNARITKTQRDPTFETREP
jgi:hypothetical protein